MADIGVIKQYQGPFNNEYTIELNGQCQIGISVNEDDYMLAGSTSGDKGVEFKINDSLHSIRIGRTYIYQTEQQYAINTITFPSGAPESTLINVVYCKERS